MNIEPKSNFFRFALGFLSLIALSVGVIFIANIWGSGSEKDKECVPICEAD